MRHNLFIHLGDDYLFSKNHSYRNDLAFDPLQNLFESIAPLREVMINLKTTRFCEIFNLIYIHQHSRTIFSIYFATVGSSI